MSLPITEVVADWIITVLEASGPAGLFAFFGLMTVESFGIPPLPSEVILPVAGILLYEGDPWFTWPSILVAGLGGGLLGAMIAYEVGRRLGLPFVRRLGHHIGLEEHDLDRAQAFFKRRGPSTVFLSRMIPLARAYISYPAGAAQMDLVQFPVYTVAGSTPFAIALVYAGYLIGQAGGAGLDRLRAVFGLLDILVFIIIVLGAVYLVWRLQQRRHRLHPPSPPEALPAAPPPPDGTGAPEVPGLSGP